MSLTEQMATVVALYRQEAVAAAEAEADHKRARAKRFLKAMHGPNPEAKSAAMAENIAEADDEVADLLSRRLIAAAIADSTRQKLMSLREEIATARSEAVTARELDKFHATDRNVP